MENSACRLQRYAKQLSQLRQPGQKIGSIVMNANPFTRGHQYLVRQAAAQCDWLHLFLVKEDNSRFPYEDRLQLVLSGTEDIGQFTVHPGSEYMISRATFPCYFIKDQGVADDCYTERSENIPPIFGSSIGRYSSLCWYRAVLYRDRQI